MGVPLLVQRCRSAADCLSEVWNSAGARDRSSSWRLSLTMSHPCKLPAFCVGKTRCRADSMPVPRCSCCLMYVVIVDFSAHVFHDKGLYAWHVLTSMVDSHNFFRCKPCPFSRPIVWVGLVKFSELRVHVQLCSNCLRPDVHCESINPQSFNMGREDPLLVTVHRNSSGADWLFKSALAK